MPIRRDAIVSYLPRLALRQILSDVRLDAAAWEDHFAAAVLLVDVSGFSSLAERLAAEGPDSGEALTLLLNAFLCDLIEIVDQHGGDVFKFAGDAMLVLWPAVDTPEELPTLVLRAAQCGLALLKTATQSRASGASQLSLHAGLGAGQLRVAHLGGVYGRWDLVVSGASLDAMGPALHHSAPGELVLTGDAWVQGGQEFYGFALEDGCFRLEGIRNSLPTRVSEEVFMPPGREAALEAYLPGAIRARLKAGHAAWLCELRHVTVIFVNLPDLVWTMPLERAQDVMVALQAAVYRFEGSINKLSVDEKGISLVAVLGLPPLAHEDDPIRGIGAAQDIRERLDDLGVRSCVGIASGRAFCGEVGSARRREYTVMGDIVNLAARLMQASGAGILCDQATFERSRGTFEFEALDPIPLKGKSGTFPIFRPLGRAAAPSHAAVVPLGREKERQGLDGCLNSLLRGRGGVVVIRGEAGIGKSVLAVDFARSAQKAGVRAFLLAADPIECRTAYYPWRSLLSTILDLDRASASEPRNVRAASMLERLLGGCNRGALLNHLLGLDLPDSEFTARLEGDLRAQSTLSLLKEILGAYTQDVPMLIVLENAHWMDSSSWIFCSELLKLGRSLLLLFTIRPNTNVPPQEARALLEDTCLELDLTPLSASESRDLVARRLGIETVPDPVWRLIWDRAAGHPLYTEELAIALDEAARAEGKAGVVRNVMGWDPRSVAIPTSLEGVVMGRIDRLSPSAQLALKVASVIGHSFEPDTLAAAHPLPDQRSSLDVAVRELEDHDFILSGDQGSGATYAFRHALTREVAYNLLLGSQRKGIHRSIVRVLESRDQADDVHIPLLAHHCRLAGDIDKAISYLEAAGQLAEEAGAYEEATTCYRDALDCDPQPSGQKENLRFGRLCQRIGHIYKGIGRLPESRDFLIRAVTLAGEFGDSQIHAQALLSLGQLHLLEHRYDESLLALELAESLAAARDDGRTRLRCLHAIARAQYRAGHPALAMEASANAIDLGLNSTVPLDASSSEAFLGHLYVSYEVSGLALRERMERGSKLLKEAVLAKRSLGDKVALLDCLNLLGHATWMVGDFDQATRFFQEGLAISDELGAVHESVCACLNLAIQALEVASYLAARTHATLAKSRAHAAGYADFEIIGGSLEGVAAGFLGELAVADKIMTTAAESLDSLPAESRKAIEATTLPFLARYLMLTGRFGEAAEVASCAWGSLVQSGLHDYRPHVLLVLGQAHLGQGNLAVAAQWFNRALVLGQEVGLTETTIWARVGLADIALHEGNRWQAQATLGEIEIQGRSSRYAMGEAALRQGLIASESGDRQHASTLFGEVLTIGESLAIPHLQVRALLGLAQSSVDPQQATCFAARGRLVVDAMLAGVPEGRRRDTIAAFGWADLFQKD